MFADMVGVDESTLSCYISGQITISPPRAVTIERETKRIDPEDFITAHELVFGKEGDNA
jgi:DNA-binding transcriptional regulator YdaS (Cro superfamily)